ncbi:MAG: 1-acyl-sn-glycerol-3-phosphate acyltransferase [Bacteroidaceae bacterium]|nr:1-acyl-sn-glycerol-3-phosphate acyltransferase [Bacteroidaceae bacterium]
MSEQLSQYDEIRPYSPEELPAVLSELLEDPMFTAIVQNFFQGVPVEALKAKMLSCRNNLEFQKAFIYPLIKQLLAKNCTGLTFESALAPTKRYTYVSNHRDIVLDSALLSIVLIENGFEDTPEIAIGDNLLIYPWIKKLVRVNKSFIVQRSLSMREMLESSRRMSSYMHYAINEKQQSIWIAQREGRAKDSNDRTQESVLKMMAMGGEGTPTERLKSLNIAPLSISYEYDPCDYLKAQEFQQKRDNPDFKKSREDDLKNMQTGIFGYKGQVHYQVAPCINEWIDEMSTLPKGEFFSAVAQRMDADIFRNYRLYPGNYVAADLLESSTRFASHYTEEQKQQFEKYVQSRIALVELPNPDTAYLRERILEMYANPVLNQLSVQQ